MVDIINKLLHYKHYNGNVASDLRIIALSDITEG